MRDAPNGGSGDISLVYSLNLVPKTHMQQEYTKRLHVSEGWDGRAVSGLAF